MLLDSHKAESHQLTILFELLGSDPAKHLNHFTCQLKWSLFELEAFAGGIREQETEIDVHYMPSNVNHDITVVAILDLENIANKGIGSKRGAEVAASFFEF